MFIFIFRSLSRENIFSVWGIARICIEINCEVIAIVLIRQLNTPTVFRLRKSSSGRHILNRFYIRGGKLTLATRREKRGLVYRILCIYFQIIVPRCDNADRGNDNCESTEKSVGQELPLNR